MSLLDKAKIHKKEHPRRSTAPQDEEKELALAWVRDEVNLRQVAAAIGMSHQSAYTFLASVLKEVVKDLLPQLP